MLSNSERSTNSGLAHELSITRRDALRAGGVGALGLTVGSLSQMRVQADRPQVDGAGAAPPVARDDRWWPVQILPRAVVRTHQGSTLDYQMMVQSIAGLAAKAVNQNNGDELIWVLTNNIDLEAWYDAFVKQHSSLVVQDMLDSWELVERYLDQGIIKGYIVYSPDNSDGQTNDHRKGIDLSVNVATSMAGLLDGVIIDERLEDEARAHGLVKLFDARGKTQQWCFESYNDRFNRRLLCAQDPLKPHLRDLAIAHQALTIYGAEEPTESAMKWLEPLSPIAGWNGGDEFETTRLSSIYGHLQTATDWCMNLTVLMAGSEQAPVRAAKTFDPRSIDWSDHRSCVSFILSDGDNVQWLESSFFYGNTSYWANPERGSIPFGWSCCFAQLAQLCPVAINHALDTQTKNDQFIEWGAGYYYPDLFGHARSDRTELLQRHARRTWNFMQQSGVRVLAFNVADIDSPEALKAYETIVGETDGLSAILVFQYAPYEAGAGKTFWIRDRRGVEIPVISARYSIWEHSNDRARSGTPAKVARDIRESTAGTTPQHDWGIVHAWSYFQHAPQADEDAENMPQDGAPALGGVRGYTPALWCAERLPAEVRVVTPEELIWRTRMEHDPAVTQKLLADG